MANPLHPIPHPPRWPLIGNLRSLSFESPAQHMAQMLRELGPIFWLDMPGIPLVVVGSAELAAEVCDTTRFDKCTIGVLRRLRRLSHGLFTSDTTQDTWRQPHAILVPHFGQKAIRAYHPMMLDIARQLVDKWGRLNADDTVDVAREMTALTLDTIGLCGFGYRFNSFYRDGFHPFVDAMVRTLETTQRRRGAPLEKWRMRRPIAQLQADVAQMHAMVEGLIRERRAETAPFGGGAEPRDLLDAMIHGTDRATGQGLDDRQIRDECIEFLIAGHETTSGLLSFAIHALITHPEVLARARAEVDAVFGTDLSQWPTVDQVSRLVQVPQVLKEALRLWPTAPAIALQAKADTVIGGRYPVPRHALVFLNGLALHRDPAVWGPEPERFDPERFSRQAEAARPAHAYKPFGNGQRACIGRQFALQEATLVLGLLLQRFDLALEDGYRLRIREALTLKPDGLRLRVRARARPSAGAVAPGVVARPVPAGALAGPATAAGGLAAAAPAVPPHGTPLWLLHASHGGTAEDLARQLAEAGRQRGFAVRLATIDEALLPDDTGSGTLPRGPDGGAVLLVCASYNGTPPQPAQRLWQALQAPPPSAGATPAWGYAVFGCGNRDWASTYQAVPRALDQGLAAIGAQRLHDRGEGDARDDLALGFDTWCEGLWPALARALGLPQVAPAAAATPDPASASTAASASGAGPGATPAPALQLHWLEADAAPERPPQARQLGLQPCTVLVNRELQQGVDGAPPERRTRHLELAPPPGQTWRVGDHLVVLPRNPPALVARWLQRLGLDGVQRLQLSAAGAAGRWSHLALDRPVSVAQLLAEGVALQSPARPRQAQALAALTECPHTRGRLLAWAEAAAARPDAPTAQPDAATAQPDAATAQPEVPTTLSDAPGPTLLAVLQAHPACQPTLQDLLPLLPPLAPRYYSIASSPLADANRLAITVSVVDAPAWPASAEGWAQGPGGGAGQASAAPLRWQGVCSTMLRDAAPGTVLLAGVRPGGAGFTLPDDPAVPLLMVAAGSGIAPFRGFVQQRSVLAAQGARLGPAVLVFGCRHPARDALYADELQAWAAQGLVSVWPAHSRVGPQPVYVQHRLRGQAPEVARLLADGARVFVCGDGARMEPAVRQALDDIARDQGLAPADGPGWVAAASAAGRYQVDVWAGG